MVYDAIIVGGGVSGLMTAYNLTLQKRRVLVVERGRQFYERHHKKPFDVTNGIGGSGLFSDGKVSLFPSASFLWKLNKSILHPAYDKVESFLRDFDCEIPPFSEEWIYAAAKYDDSCEKKYDSVMLSQNQRTMIAFKLIQTIGQDNIVANTEVTRIINRTGVFELEVKNGSSVSSCLAHSVVLAGGKHQFETIMPNLSGVQFDSYNRYEVGIRVECSNSDFDYYNAPQPDIKLIERIGGFEVRTFCCCKGGCVLESCSDGFPSFNGTSNDFKNSDKTNVGFIVSIPSESATEEMIASLRQKKNGSMPLSEFLNTSEVVITEEVDEIIKYFIAKNFSQMAQRNQGIVYYPEFERFGAYPVLGNDLQLNGCGIWMTGDSTGLFRGLLPAFVSGTFVAHFVNGYVASCEQELMRRFHIKESASNKRKVVFTAQSKQKFFCRNAVCEYVFKNGCIPVNPFRIFGYFLDDRVDRGLVRNGNNEMISRCDELWVFGPISDGVLFEIFSCIKQGKPVRFFSIETWAKDIKEITLDDIVFEPEVHSYQIKKEDLKRLVEYGGGIEPVKQLRLFDEP